MKIQIISNTKNIACDGFDCTYSQLESPKTLDSFDFNIVDLQDESIWKNEKDDPNFVNRINDFITVKKLISSANKTQVIVALPQNYRLRYCQRGGGTYYYNPPLKDKISNLLKILSYIVPDTLKVHDDYGYSLIYEDSCTNCRGSKFPSAFCFSRCPYNSELTSAVDSGKATTFRATDHCVMTTLLLSQKVCKLEDFLLQTGLVKEKAAELPQWLTETEMFDDSALNESVKASENAIAEHNEKIA